MKSQYYRTFIGLPLRVDEQFLQASENLRAALNEERISWTNPDQYHVTLRFLGDTEPGNIRKIGSALQAGIPVPKQISLKISGLGSFGPNKRPRVIWVGFEESGFFETLKLEVDRVLELCGIPAMEQPFRAHLTLGRVRSLQDLNGYYKVLEDLDQQYNTSVSFDKLVFFRSILGPGGPGYHVLEELKFKL